MKRKELLTIGELSKYTGVGIQSLRYYDNLGILRPKSIDPHTRYRYYSEEQVEIVEAIQMCIQFGIPLKHFPEYMKEEKIEYHKLLIHGESNIQNQLKEIRQKTEYLKQMKMQFQ